MPTCVVYGCTNRSNAKNKKQVEFEKSNGKITFHLFSKDAEKRRQWIHALRRKNWQPTDTSRICSVHFEEEYFDKTSLSVIRLRENAIPTIFPTGLEQKIRRNCKLPIRKSPDHSNTPEKSPLSSAPPVHQMLQEELPVLSDKTPIKRSLSCSSIDIYEEPIPSPISPAFTQSPKTSSAESTSTTQNIPPLIPSRKFKKESLISKQKKLPLTSHTIKKFSLSEVPSITSISLDENSMYTKVKLVPENISPQILQKGCKIQSQVPSTISSVKSIQEPLIIKNISLDGCQNPLKEEDLTLAKTSSILKCLLQETCQTQERKQELSDPLSSPTLFASDESENIEISPVSTDHAYTTISLEKKFELELRNRMEIFRNAYQEKTKLYKRKIRNLQSTVLRQKKKIDSLTNIVSSLKNENIITLDDIAILSKISVPNKVKLWRQVNQRKQELDKDNPELMAKQI